MPLLKILFLYLFTTTVSFGCATCLLMVPTVELDVELKIRNKELNKIHIVWNFSDIYADEMKTQYDKDMNGLLDKN